MFDKLPPDIVRHIYFFDSTYYDFYTKNIIPLIKKRMFTCKNQALYCVVDLKNSNSLDFLKKTIYR